jgi:hypothetical protein
LFCMHQVQKIKATSFSSISFLPRDASVRQIPISQQIVDSYVK